MMIQNNKSSHHNNTILIIDSAPTELRKLGKLVQPQADVLCATSGEAGLFIAYQRKPQLIIVNMALSDMTGIHVCLQLKQMKETANIAVIVIEEHYDPEHEVAALEAGALDFMSKPLTDCVLQARIKTFLGLSRHQDLLQNLAEKDGLTEVYNRRFLTEQGRLELKRHYRQQQPLTLALLDIDHFKLYNDAYGHLQGDLCLREVAQSIATATRRPGEFVARYGGEEFAVVLPDTNLHNAKKYGQWICDQVLSLAIPHAYSMTLPFVSVSVGIASVTPSAQTTLEDLITTADSALYLAKESGRNQHKVATITPESIREVG
jgi:diguanylate cyclase (GGDEF)-like protein